MDTEFSKLCLKLGDEWYVLFLGCGEDLVMGGIFFYFGFLVYIENLYE